MEIRSFWAIVTVVCICFAGMVSTEDDIPNNYSQSVSCDFEQDLCGWNNVHALSTSHALWQRAHRATHPGSEWVLQLKIPSPGITGQLTIGRLAAIPGYQCMLQFVYDIYPNTNNCRLQVFQNNGTSVKYIWIFDARPGQVNNANMSVDCASHGYWIEIESYMLQGVFPLTCRIELDNIVYQRFPIQHPVSEVTTQMITTSTTPTTPTISTTTPPPLPVTTAYNSGDTTSADFTNFLTSTDPATKTSVLTSQASSGLSDGALAGTVAACSSLAVFILGLFCFLWRKDKLPRLYNQNHMPDLVLDSVDTRAEENIYQNPPPPRQGFENNANSCGNIPLESVGNSRQDSVNRPATTNEYGSPSGSLQDQPPDYENRIYDRLDRSQLEESHYETLNTQRQKKH